MKNLARTLLVAGLGAWLPMAASAQAPFPTKPVRIVVPFVPGGSSDSSARLVAEHLSAKWKQPVLVENRPGANGALGAAQVAKAAPDGHTIYYAPVSIGTVNLFVKNPGFDPLKDLAPVTLVARGDYVLNVNKDVPVGTIAEFAQYARANEGKVFHGAFGGGSQLAFEHLGHLLGFRATNVSYRGEAPAITALIGGEVQAMFSTLTTARPYIESGRIKALGLASKTRSPIAPDIRTADESGARGFYVDFWFGLMVPGGTPPALVRTINADVKDTLSSPAIRGRFFGMGLTASPTTPEEFGRIVRYESERWVETARRAGVEPQ